MAAKKAAEGKTENSKPAEENKPEIKPEEKNDTKSDPKTVPTFSNSTSTNLLDKYRKYYG